MRRIILACALAGVLGVPAKADETLKFRIVSHTASNQNQRVGDVERHFMGVVREIGTASFPDGSTGTTLSVGTFDVIVDSQGTNNGYGSITFPDGSELWLKWAGTIKFEGANRLTEKGTGIVIGGKGRYAGAKGDGTWEGEATRGPDATAQIDNVVNIKK